jgi:hypothetical protein
VIVAGLVEWNLPVSVAVAVTVWNWIEKPPLWLGSGAHAEQSEIGALADAL